MDYLVNADEKFNNTCGKSMRNSWSIITRPDVEIMDIEEPQANGIENIFSKIINFPKFRERETHPGTRGIKNTK